MTTVELSPEAAESRANEVLEVIAQNRELSESLSAIAKVLRLEDEHWSSIFGTPQHDGLTIDEIQELSQNIREAMVKSPIIDRGAQLRHSYVWSKGLNLPETPKEETGEDGKPKRGPKSAEYRAHQLIDDDINQRYVFSAAAHEEMERAAYSDGNFFLLGDNATKQIRRIPINEITNFITNPDFKEEVWAWKRTWQSTNRRGKTEEVSAWYYTDDCPAPMADRARVQIQNTKVDHTKTIIAQSFNRMVGWPLGIPDAVAVVAWAKLYSEFLKHGYVMSRALASIAFKATAPTKGAGDKMAMKLSSTNTSGNTAVMGSASDLTALPTAGRGYDFNSARPIAAMVATGVQVSIVHLLSDPGAAGSSYGSASNLDLPTKRAIVARQRSWTSFFTRVLKWLGLPNAKVDFPTLEEPDFFREMQSLVQAFETGEIHHDEIRPRLLKLAGIEPLHDESPEGVMLPNNKESWERSDIDPKDGPAGSGGSMSSKQGKTSPLTKGKSSNSNDIRSDSQTDSLVQLMTFIAEKLDRLAPDA